MKCKLLVDQEGLTGPLLAGEVIEHRDAFRLVELGVAEPADDECDKALEPWRKMQAKRAAVHAAAVAAEEARIKAEKELAEKLMHEEFEQLLREGPHEPA